MPHFSTSKIVSLNAAQAFAIAADVNSYKDFLPLLKRSQIRGGKTVVGDEEHFSADLQIAYAKLGFSESFTSHVTTNESLKTVTATSADGPIKSLKAIWKITEIAAQQCSVEISIDYTLKNMMLQMMAGGMMDFATQKIMHAFEDRGFSLYGTVLI
jgi:coenzyme Q-binding protein COQ10